MSHEVASTRPEILPIRESDARAVAEFFHRHLNSRIRPEQWMAVLSPPWEGGPNHGFQLVSNGEIVGAYAAVYSSRSHQGELVDYCNLAAFCVLEEHRAHSLRLVRALLGQKGFVFTDLSPSGNVPAMNDRLGFTRLDTAARMSVNLPTRRRGSVLIEDPGEIAAVLGADDASLFEDHRNAPAARHIVVQAGDRYAYLMYRRDRRKRLALFATPLYVGGDVSLLEEHWPSIGSRLLRRGYVATLAESRVLGFRPAGPGRDLRSPRPRMFKAVRGRTPDVDYLYSELTLLEW